MYAYFDRAGLASANRADLAVMILPVVIPVLWRIHVEESALMTTLGDRYRAYAAQHKRLVPARVLTGEPQP
jgi:protein-S-isoprenylcysteine O-methyltransferase Ste14